MAAEARVRGVLNVLGLGAEQEFAFNTTTTTTPTRVHYNYRQQAAADTAEAIALGGVTTEHLLVIKAVTNDMLVDLDFSSAFDADLTIPQGEVAVIPKPAGIIYIKNATSNEQVTYEYYLVGV